MDIYIQSRGFEQDYDYRWLQVGNDGSIQPKLPPIGLTVTHLIDRETPTVVLERLMDNQLLLLLTGLEPKGRVDFLDRQIRIAMAWVGATTDEPLLRSLAASALIDQEYHPLVAQLNQAVCLGGNYGFQVSFPQMQGLLTVVRNPQQLSSEPPTLTPKIGRNIATLRQELAEELRTCHLPPTPGILIVVTGIKKPETLQEAGVWRSLSTLVEGDSWQDLSPQPWFLPANLQEGTQSKNPLIWLMVLISILSYWLASLVKLLSSQKDT
ncbi:hypothetical protein [Coleofasciculus sp.]|uniref:hypothetical protein n=1 Tax=Coleofasciculus sp. TaxID=3100458 RepID=UPI0039FB4D20